MESFIGQVDTQDPGLTVDEAELEVSPTPQHTTNHSRHCTFCTNPLVQLAILQAPQYPINLIEQAALSARRCERGVQQQVLTVYNTARFPSHPSSSDATGLCTRGPRGDEK